MSKELLSHRIGRRTILRAGTAIGALQLTSPFIIKARGEEPLKIGMIDPITGVYSAPANSEVEGAKFAVDELNKKGGILGRQVQLLVEDSANDVGTGVQKARKLIDRDQVNFILADVNSAIAYAIAGVTNEKKILHIVPGGHTDPITGKDCKWNVFRVCNTTAMDANAIADTLIKKFGNKWYFLTPDYAYGHTLQEGFVKKLTAAGGTYEGDLLPIGTADFSASLIKAKQYGPKVLLDIMGGADQVNSLKQFVQFGMDKEMAVGGALYELESMRAVPKEALTGWWTMEWWWDQPNVPHVKEWVAALKQATGKTPSARHWFGYVAVHTCALAANAAKVIDAVKMAHALEGMKLPPEIALQPGDVAYRAGDHELMSSIFVGDAHPAPAGGDSDNMFTIQSTVPGETAAGSAEATGCKVVWPSQASAPGGRGQDKIMTTLILFNVTNGLIIGAFYVLMALGLSLILNLSGVINFAHGGFLTLGGYIAFALSARIGFWGGLLVAPFIVALLGIFIEWSMIRRLYGRDPLYSLLLTFGLAFILEDGTRWYWGPEGLPVTIPAFLAQPLSTSLFFITGYRLFMVVVAASVIVALFFFLRFTRLGLRIRAGTLDLDTVSSLGVNVRLLRSFNFGLGIFLAGLSGVLAGGQLGLIPTMGTALLMPSFIAIIVGGVGSLPGTLVGGLLIGLASGLTTVFWPSASEAVMYVLMAVVLIVRPRGLFGEEGMLT